MTQTASELRFHLDTPLPEAIGPGETTGLFLAWWCFHPSQRIERVHVSVDGERRAEATARMPRLDVFHAFESQAHSYRSGFWSTPTFTGPSSGEPVVEVGLEAELDDGTTATAPLGRISVAEPPGPAAYERPGGDRELIAVCMATFEPPEDLFRVQVDSIRDQTDEDWVCVISDDCSSAGGRATIERVVGADPRFIVSHSERRLGFYGNFERALRLAPSQARLLALSDQDDRWYPDKLEALRAAIGTTAQLAYSDVRLVDERGDVLSSTFWDGRRNNYSNLASLLIANTITGGSMLLRREAVALALPFPRGPGWEFHDHWLAQVALSSGEVAYVNRPLYDYVQHSSAVISGVPEEASAPPLARRVRDALTGWRGAFARSRAAYFRVYVHLGLQAQVLLARCAPRLSPPKRRTLRRVAGADRSWLGVAWLLARRLRRLVGRDETLGAEMVLVRGLAWRRLVALRARRERPGRSPVDASLPPLDPAGIGHRRIERWRARLSTPGVGSGAAQRVPSREVGQAGEAIERSPRQ